MIRIVFRQLIKHWKALLPITLLWVVVGYLFFSTDHDLIRDLFPPGVGTTHQSHTNSHSIFQSIVAFFNTYPEPGQQWPDQAYNDFVGPALDLLHKDRKFALCTLPSFQSRCKWDASGPNINPGIMQRACERSGKVLRKGFDPYTDDWLTQIEVWKIENRSSPSTSPVTVHGGQYWDSHIDEVLDGLRLSISAMRYAYEIPPETHGIEGIRQSIPVVELVELFARSACKQDLGTLSWGQYAQFLETRAYNRLKNSPLHKSERHLFPLEKQILILQELRSKEQYLHALEKYGAGPVPDPFQVNCNAVSFQLPCYSPREAEKVYSKRLYFSNQSDSYFLYLELAKIQLRLALMDGRESGSSFHSRVHSAMDYLSGASRSHTTEVNARLLTARVHLMNEDYREAYDELARLSLSLPNRGKSDIRFRKLARMTLLGLGEARASDCYAEHPEMVTGVRSGCETLPEIGSGDF